MTDENQSTVQADQTQSDMVTLEEFLEDTKADLVMLVQQLISDGLGEIESKMDTAKPSTTNAGKPSMLESENKELKQKLADLEAKLYGITVKSELESVAYQYDLIPEIALPYLQGKIKVKDDSSIVAMDGDNEVELKQFVETLINTDLGKSLKKSTVKGVNVSRSPINGNTNNDVASMLQKALLGN